jgi:uncharacterized protein (TIGR01777 family)
MKILISGASGLIGKALTDYLTIQGHDIFSLQRKSPLATPYWDIEHNIITLEKSLRIDAVIHLAGESIVEGRWNKRKKDKIANSRIKGTKLLADYFSKAAHKPKVFISCSAIGFYGNRQDETLTEQSEKGNSFLANVCQEWENAASSAAQAGIRVVYLRLGMVLSAHGGALQKMVLPFKMGLGGIIGNGRQYVSWVAIHDVARAVNHIIKNETIEGAVNIVSPNPVTNSTFTKFLGQTLHRPTFLPLPSFLVKLFFGEMAEELLLASAKVMPQKLLTSGYIFKYPELTIALKKYLTNEY